MQRVEAVGEHRVGQRLTPGHASRKADAMRNGKLVLVVAMLLVLGAGRVEQLARADGTNKTTVVAFGTDSYTRYFATGAIVSIGVRGDGDTDLDLYVRCPCDRVIAQDEDPTDRCFVRFQAPESGFYSIRVVNRGPLSNAYRIAVED
jgi:hypothetical protein